MDHVLDGGEWKERVVRHGFLQSLDVCPHSNASFVSLSCQGYGIIFPATGASDFYVPTGCVGVGVLGSFEAFLRVLFAGFITSILFGKVLRSQNNAQVYFSDPIVVRYGKTELEQSGNSFIKKNDAAKGSEEGPDEETGDGGGERVLDAVASNQENIPCPSLEFGLVNRLHDAFSGEIGELSVWSSSGPSFWHLLII